jgi:tetratricopeptide (TPR) repeat protein
LAEQAKAAMGIGLDPAELLRAAESSVSQALRHALFFNRAGLTRASILRLRGVHEDQSGKDPSPWLARARADLAEILRVNPLAAEAWVEQGRTEFDWGRSRARAGRQSEARDHFTLSIRSYEEALRLNPFYPGRLREPLKDARRALLATY